MIGPGGATMGLNCTSEGVEGVVIVVVVVVVYVEDVNGSCCHFQLDGGDIV
jgi:hypothetical protein